MDFLKVLIKSMDDIINEKGQEQAVEQVVNHLKENGFPPSQNKEILIKSLNKIIHEEGPDDMGQIMDMVIGVERTAIKLTKPQADNLRKIRTAVEEAETHNICPHKNIAMIGSLHGGGFTPMISLPEVVCRDCGANVTLYFMQYEVTELEPEKCGEAYGIEIGKSGIEKLKQWVGADMSDTRKKSAYGEEVVKDPQGVLARCTLWEGKLPFEIVDPALFSARSGK